MMWERVVLAAVLCNLLTTDRVVVQSYPQKVEIVEEYYACAYPNEVWVEYRQNYLVDGKSTGENNEIKERVWERKRGREPEPPPKN